MATVGHTTRALARANAGAFHLDRRLLRALGGRRPPEAARIAPDAWLLCELDANSPLPRMHEVGPVRARRQYEWLSAALSPEQRLPLRITERSVPGPAGPVACRLYEPRSAPAPGPLVVYLHGGGWVIGSLETHEQFLRLVAHHSGLRVLAVDYRLAPEHPWPAALQDAMAVWEWVSTHAGDLGADEERLAVAGDSAGGHLAALIAQRSAGAGLRPPVFQMLVYPATDISRRGGAGSLADYSWGYVLTRAMMDWFAELTFQGGENFTDRSVSPLLVDDLSGLAPTQVVVGEVDPLRDEGIAYAHRLRAAGVSASIARPPLPHGFVGFPALPSAKAACLAIAGALRQGMDDATAGIAHRRARLGRHAARAAHA